MRKIKVFIIISSIFLLSSVAFAKDLNFEATIDRNKVGLGQSLELDLTFDGTQDMPAVDLPSIEGFQAHYVGPSTRMSVINGQVSNSITHVYTLLPTKTGTFQLGPFQAEHKGDSYHSNSVSVEVVEGAAQPEEQSSASEQINAKDLSDRIFLVMHIKKKKVYLNEVVPVTIKLCVNRLGIRDIQYPEFSHDGFSVGEFSKPRQYQGVAEGINYDIIEFDTTIFGLRPGEFRLGPANLQCSLIVK
ncbi:MAG: BatD family protein, partial [Candidatus Omnitrophica bacterium]|nr:BatD family protein [Candidatus Omnitrophota bacterium]